MGQGTSTPPATPATPAAPPASGQTGSGLTPQQMQAVAMLLSQMGKDQQTAAGMRTPTQSALPTQTIQGGTYFNPNRQ